MRVLPLNTLLERLAQPDYCGVLLQSPTSDGELLNLEPVVKAAHAAQVCFALLPFLFLFLFLFAFLFAALPPPPVTAYH